MREKKKKLNKFFTYLGYIATLLMVLYAGIFLLQGLESYILYAAVLIIAGLLIKFNLRTAKTEIIYFWNDIYKSVCTKVNYSSSEFGLKRNIGLILSDIYQLENILGVWVLFKNDDGHFRLYSQRGGDFLKHNYGIKNLNDYLNMDSKKFESPLIKEELPVTIDKHKKASALHMPLTSGKILNGVLTVIAPSSRYFKKYGVANFRVVAEFIEQLYQNAAKNNQLKNVARKVNKKVDVATDELTNTNLRLIDRVKELKSLYDLSLKVINAEDTSEAAGFIFEKTDEILGADKSIFFEKDGKEFYLKYISKDKAGEELKKYSLPVSILPRKKGIVLDDTSRDSDLKKIADRFSLNQVMIAPVKAGENIKGVIIAGSTTEKSFSGRDIELLEMYSGRLGSYIERKNLLDRIVQDNRKLKELNEVKDKFIALISHELRTPLTSIKGFSELLINEDPGEINSDQRDFLVTILKSAINLEKTINNIIEVTDFKKEEIDLDLEDVDWENFIEKTVKEFDDILNNKGISCTINIDDDVDKIRIDKRRIKKVFKNLISNSIKFMGKGGEIEISSELKEGFIRTAVKDTGMGIEDGAQEKVFDKFFQAGDTLTRDAGGMGLGLTLVKYIVESHGGNIELNSKVGEGTKIIFNIPSGR